LDGSGKVLERLLLESLFPHTMDAIHQVLCAVRAAGRGAVQNRDLCVLITIDVKNAFNTAPWQLIYAALRRCATPDYIINILRSYMDNGELIVGENDRPPVTCGVSQGSVLGLTLWNLFYDGVLRLPMPDGIKLVAVKRAVRYLGVQLDTRL